MSKNQRRARQPKASIGETRASIASPKLCENISRALSPWFVRVQRPMPWREHRTPYRVWISEVMLQQTQVVTVIPYFERFMSRFPDVRALAEAPLDDVLRLWAGLGYYSRARNLHKGARHILTEFGGELPRTRDELLSVPGIGEYTAGAILSIAYNLPEALVDGNVARVVSRLFKIATPWQLPEGRKSCWQAARELNEAGARAGTEPRVLNQGLMELGATVCSPRKPDCVNCPLRDLCEACRTGEQESFPSAFERKKQTVMKLTAWAIFDRRGSLLLARREPRGLFGGLWELPTTLASKSIKEKDLPGDALFKLRHVLTHRILDIRVRRLRIDDKHPDAATESGNYDAKEWFSLETLLGGDGPALSSAHKTIIERISNIPCEI